MIQIEIPVGPLIELDRSVILKHEWKQKGPRKSEGAWRKGCPGGLQGYLTPGRTAHSQNQEEPEHWELGAELDPPAVDKAGFREWCRLQSLLWPGGLWFSHLPRPMPTV